MNDWTERAIDRLLGEVGDEPTASPALPTRYRVIREIGRGGMGSVFEAEDLELRRRVAVKVVSEVLRDPNARERFVREARAAARLAHPSIAQVYDAGEGFIVMRLVDGEPLSQRPRTPARDAARWIRDAALAAGAAHEKGIVHRDLKPSNLLLENDHCVITDFGLAKDVTAGELSVSGQVLGTPSYMAPEQAEGRAARIDGTTDVYGLGATLYFLLLGRAPFVARDREDVLSLLRRVVDEDPPRPRELDPNVPRDLEAIVLRAIEKDNSRRYASARDLADDLSNFLDGRPVVARPSTILSRALRLAARHRRAVAFVFAALFVIAIALAYAWSERSRREASSAALTLSDLVRAVLEDARSGLELGEIEQREERLREGLAECDRFLAAHDVGWAHVLRGRLLAESGETIAAIAAFDRALSVDRELLAARLARGSVRIDELFRRLGGRRPDALAEFDVDEASLHRAALDDLRAARSLTEPSGVERALCEADLAAITGDLPTARRIYDEVRRDEPTNERARRGLLVIALATGEGDEALALAMSGMDVRRGHGPAYEARVRARSAETTAPGLERAIAERSPDFQLAGSRWSVTGFEAALVARPSDALAHAQRGVVALRRAAQVRTRADEFEAATRSAIDSFDGAIVLDPTIASFFNGRAVARLELAGLLETTGRDDEGATERGKARADLERALALDPRDDCARANRDRLGD